MIVLSVCHTVIPEMQDKDANAIPTPANIAYRASSPDESALVKGATQLGYFFHTRRPKSVTITTPFSSSLEYQILAVCEFNSTRKRMSTIVRTPSGEVKIFVKGAETVIYERLHRLPNNGGSWTGGPMGDMAQYEGVNPYAAKTAKLLENFATAGLRTLCIACREIPEKEYKQWKVMFDAASISLTNRSEEVLII